MPYRAPGEDEYQGGGDFTLLDDDEYIVQVLSHEEKPNVPNQYNPEGTGTTVWFKLKPLAYAADEEAELVDENGDPLHPDRTLIFFYDPKRLGLKPKIARSRKFLAAALNMPVMEPIEFDSYDDLVGKKLIASVVKSNGKNKIDDVRAIKNRRGKAAATAKAPVSAAAAIKETMGDDVSEPTPDSEDY